MEDNEIVEKILALKKKLNAVIIVHNYQRDEVQDIADYLGDSLGLSRTAAETKADVIVFCGVYFMAETASILSPGKTVLLPEIDAGCPMADMINADQLREMKKKYPGAKVVCYVNSSAEVKAESDICCTSANAVAVVESIPLGEEIIFVPDRNLGAYVAGVTGRDIILWEGYCPTHDRLLYDDIKKAKELYPEASLWSHPECTQDILRESDRILSTGGMCKAAKEGDEKEVIIATEMGLVYRLKRDNPEKIFHLASEKLICPNMKLTSLESVLESMEKMQYIISVPEDIRVKAQKSINRMLEIG